MSFGSRVTNGLANVQGKFGNGSFFGNADFSDMTYGVSANGANTYLDGINTIAIGNAIAKLEDTSDIKKALQSGWQGAAEMAFEKRLDDGVDLIVNTLEEIKKGIESQITTLVEEMANQDAHMLDEIENMSISRNTDN